MREQEISPTKKLGSWSLQSHKKPTITEQERSERGVSCTDSSSSGSCWCKILTPEDPHCDEKAHIFLYYLFVPIWNIPMKQIQAAEQFCA